MNGESWQGLDVLKYVAFLLVIVLHSELPYFVSTICRWAVPFFFISSSFLFWQRGKKYSSFLKRMLLLYFAWFILEIPVIYQRFAGHSVLYFLRKLLFDNTFFGSWYLTASIEGMGLLVLLSKKLSNSWLLFCGMVLYGIALFGGGYLGLLPDAAKQAILFVDGYVPLAHSFVTSFIYLVLGKLFADNYDYLTTRFSFRFICIICVSLLVVNICEVLFIRQLYHVPYTLITLPPISFCLLYLAVYPEVWSIVNRKISLFLRKSSTLVYFTHPIILALLPITMCSDIRISLCLRPVITVVVCLVLSLIIINLSKRYSFLKVLY